MPAAGWSGLTGAEDYVACTERRKARTNRLISSENIRRIEIEPNLLERAATPRALGNGSRARMKVRLTTVVSTKYVFDLQEGASRGTHAGRSVRSVH